MAVVAVAGVDAKLAYDLKVVFAPVLDVDRPEVQGRAIVAVEGSDGAEGLGGGEVNEVQSLEFFPKILLQSCTVADVRAKGVFEIAEFRNESVLYVLLPDEGWPRTGNVRVGGFGRHGRRDGKPGILTTPEPRGTQKMWCGPAGGASAKKTVALSPEGR